MAPAIALVRRLLAESLALAAVGGGCLLCGLEHPGFQVLGLTAVIVGGAAAFVHHEAARDHWRELRSTAR